MTYTPYYADTMPNPIKIYEFSGFIQQSKWDAYTEFRAVIETKNELKKTATALMEHVCLECLSTTITLNVYMSYQFSPLSQ